MVTYQNRNESVAIDTTSVQIAPLVKDLERIIITIKNTSAAGQKITIAIGLGVTAVSGAGLVLNPNESWSESIDSTFSPSYEPYNVISDIAGGTIAIYERLRR